MAEDTPTAGEFVQSLDRGLAVIRAFGPQRPLLTLSEVSREAGISRASARRFLHTLVELGYVGTDGRAFFLRPRLLDLGFAYLSGLGLPEIAQPHLRELSERTGESTSVAILDGDDIVYVARVATYRIISAAIGVGTRLPAFATSMGRTLLAFLPPAEREAFLERVELRPLTDFTITTRARLRKALEEIAAQGWGFVDQELEEGLRSFAAPIRDASGAVTAAVNVSTPVRRGGVDETRERVVPPLLEAARRIEADLQRAGTRIR